MKYFFKKIALFFSFSICAGLVCPQDVPLARPSRQQLAFQDMELGVFIHYSIDTYAKPGAGPGETPASAFNPGDLHVEQWVRTAKAMGAKYVVLTARHEQGFCLWPTKTTQYSIKYSPYKNGKGDVVREFVNACRKYGLKPGLYTAPWIDSHWENAHGVVTTGGAGDINKLNNRSLFDEALKREKEQIHELMTGYGPLVFVWDDHFGRSDALNDKPLGGPLREFYRDFTMYAHDFQPDCLLLGRDVEHVGSEDGRASYPLWNSLNKIDGTAYSISTTYKWGHPNTGTPTGKFYCPQIAPTTVAFSKGGWMWGGYREPQPLARIMQAYYETVGRGSGLIVNLTPDRRGIIPENLVAAAEKFGEQIKETFRHPIAVSNSDKPTQIVQLDSPVSFNQVVMMEDLHAGQKIEKYIIEAFVNGRWQKIVDGQTIGHKKIDVFSPVKATAVRFIVTESLIQPAVMRSIALYNVTSD